MSVAEALLIGFLGAILLVAVIGFLFILWRVDRRLEKIHALIAAVRNPLLL